ncbi:hypothetical protein [Halostagnicola sp. A-GB9-2]|uniref:hypothetical protein n=1 Tax=Halostagnicola sp. A-GB9-2 TaxID=3048066 RepID=UPI0024BFD8FA|nr:hypothetical protein [Halostagnicola sp. A-GB9-2]MDJ1434412.1 hypothetical protein [Halostagnicola sp. A-GB9-2]
MNRRTLLIGAATVPLAGCLDFGEGGGSGLPSSGQPDLLDERGEIEIVIDGSEFNLSQDRFQAEHSQNHSLDFHLHEFDDYWYMEGIERVTVAEGVDLLPYVEYTQENDSRRLVIDETEYDDRESDTEITFFVEDDEVDPTEYELKDGDEVRVEITTE